MAGLTNAQNGRIVNMKFGGNEVKDVDDTPSSVAGKPRERMALCALCNALQGDLLARRFMEIPQARALRLLLQERRNHQRLRSHRPESALPRCCCACWQ